MYKRNRAANKSAGGKGWKIYPKMCPKSVVLSTSNINVFPYFPMFSLPSSSNLPTSHNPVTHLQCNYLRATVISVHYTIMFQETYWAFWFLHVLQTSEVKDFFLNFPIHYIPVYLQYTFKLLWCQILVSLIYHTKNIGTNNWWLAADHRSILITCIILF